MTNNIVETTNLTKKYGSFTALSGLNLTIREGEIYGFLGPNGAGKTTTLLILMGIIKPTEGEAKIFGKRLSENSYEVKKRIGMLSENRNNYDDMTAWEYLEFFGQLYEVDDFSGRAEYLLKKLDLYDWKDVLLKNFSTGMNRKLNFSRAILHSPDLIILDEPVSGLDPKGIFQVRTLLLEENKKGKSILISSHILSEVEQTADRIGILHKGKLLIEDDISRLRKIGRRENRIEIEISNLSAGLVEHLNMVDFITRIDRDENTLVISTLDDKDYRDDIGRILVEEGAVVRGMRNLENSLEEAFVAITESRVEDWIED
jgi:ABC-type multidrug transport system ATPase subunit